MGWITEKQCLVLISECSFNGMFGSHWSVGLSHCKVNKKSRGFSEMSSEMEGER